MGAFKIKDKELIKKLKENLKKEVLKNKIIKERLRLISKEINFTIKDKL